MRRKEENQMGVNRRGEKKTRGECNTLIRSDGSQMYHHLKARKAKRAVVPPPSISASVRSLMMRGSVMEGMRGADGRRRKREQSDVCDAIITNFVLLCQSRLLEGRGEGGT